MARKQTIGIRQVKILAAIDAGAVNAKSIAEWIENTTFNSVLKKQNLPQALKELETRGFITSQKDGTQKNFSITDDGVNEYQKRLKELALIQSAVQQNGVSAEEVTEAFQEGTAAQNSERKPHYESIEHLFSQENPPIQDLLTLHKRYQYLKGTVNGFHVLAITATDKEWYTSARDLIGLNARFTQVYCFYLNPETAEWVQVNKGFTETKRSDMKLSVRTLLAAVTV